jgi:hypothetical protein
VIYILLYDAAYYYMEVYVVHDVLEMYVKIL